jgi:hypothetical protein
MDSVIAIELEGSSIDVQTVRAARLARGTTRI